MREANKKALAPFVVKLVEQAPEPLTMKEIALGVLANEAAKAAAGLEKYTEEPKLREAIKHAVREFADEGQITRRGRTRGTSYSPAEHTT